MLSSHPDSCFPFIRTPRQLCKFWSLSTAPLGEAQPSPLSGGVAHAVGTLLPWPSDPSCCQHSRHSRALASPDLVVATKNTDDSEVGPGGLQLQVECWAQGTLSVHGEPEGPVTSAPFQTELVLTGSLAPWSEVISFSWPAHKAVLGRSQQPSTGPASPAS